MRTTTVLQGRSTHGNGFISNPIAYSGSLPAAGNAPAVGQHTGFRANLQPGQIFDPADFATAELAAGEIWERVLSAAVREQASDIHLSYQADGCHLAFRLDGRMFYQGVLPGELGQRLTNHIKVFAQMDLGERRRPQDGRTDVEIDGRAVDLRFSLLPSNHGEDLAIRILDRETSFISLEQLGFSERQLDGLGSLIDSPSGLILVTGATGAGKTTTMYALLNRLADGTRKIVTVEDPIEYDLPGINQAQVNLRIGVDFATLIRTVLRHDPNVIMIGEIRDAETAAAVVRAANSGRLVLATSHASHAAAAVETLVSLGAHPHFVARALRGVIAQTLVRRLCPYCSIRLEETGDAALLDDVRGLLGPHERPVLSMGRGCPHCRHSGYRGRVGLFEVVVADDGVRDLVSCGATARELHGHALRSGLITIEQAGKLAALRGLTTVEELVQNVAELWGEGQPATGLVGTR